MFGLGTALLISGLLSAAGSVVSGVVSSRNQQAVNSANVAEAQKNRDFQEYMSNTAHQREVTDLKLAGLNPWLSVSGSGAPVTSGSTATQQSVGDYGIGNAIGNVSSALQSIAFIQALNSKSTALQGKSYMNLFKKL